MLNPASASTPIAAAYLLAAGLNSEGKPSGNAPAGDFATAWARSYNAYASAGVVPGSVNTGGDASGIEQFFNSVDNSTAMAGQFAQALADFWATVAIEPGQPAHGGINVISVTNDAAAHVSAFESAIHASVTNAVRAPYFLHLIENIQAIAVAQITWTVTELMPGTPPTPHAFSEAIQ